MNGEFEGGREKEELLRELDHLRFMLDTSPQIRWTGNAQGEITWISKHWVEVTGHPCDAALGVGWAEFLHPDDIAATSEEVRRAVSTETIYDVEYRVRHADGTYRWMRGRAVPRKDGDGTLWYGMTEDIHERKSAEAEVASVVQNLQVTQESLSLAMKGGRMGWWTRDLRTDEVIWSPELEEIFGYPPQGFAGTRRSFLDHVHPDDVATFKAAVEHALSSRTDYTVVFRFHRLDGSEGWMEGRGQAVYDTEGRALASYGVGIDITAQRQTQEAAEGQLRVTQTIADNADSPLMLLDGDGYTTYANPAFFRVTGYAPEEVMGRRAHELIHYRYPDGRPYPIEECPIDASYRELRPQRGIKETFLRKDGAFFPVVAHVAPLRDEQGNSAGGVLEFRDVTEERQRERRLSFIVELERTMLTISDPERAMAVVTEMLGRQLGASRCAYAEVDLEAGTFTIIRDWSPGLPSTAGTYPIAAFGDRIPVAQMAGETVVVRSLREEFASDPAAVGLGAMGIEAVVSVPLVREGKLVAMMAVHQDAPRDWTPYEIALVSQTAQRSWPIIQRARSERALTRSEAQYRQVAEGLPQLVWSALPSGERDFYNQRWFDYTGGSGSALADLWAETLHPDNREAALARWRRSVETGETFEAEYRLRRHDGEYRWFLGRALPIRGEDGKVIRWFGTCTDIHDRKSTERVLAVSNEFAKTLSADLDLDRIVQALTDACTQAIGAEFGSFFYNVVGEEGEALLLYTLSGAPIEAFEKFGLPRPTKVFGPTFRNEEIVRSDDITKDPRYGSMGPHHGMPAGHLPVVSYLAVSVVSRSGEVIGGLFFGHPKPGVFTEEHERIVSSFASQAAVAIDNARLYSSVTSMKETLERQVAERTADLQSSNEALQGFTYHVAHDLRAPLRTIVSTSRIVQEDYGDHLPPDASELLERQALAAGRLGRLIDDLLRMARLTREEARREAVDVTRMARDVAAEALESHPESRVGVEIQDGLAAQADPRLFRLALGNLVENAVKYSPNGGTVRVGRREDGAYFVSDEGIGIDARYFAKVFEPFQRLHRDDEFSGTGIGLSNVQQIIARHGGRVWVESELGKGSTFLFTLG